MYVYRGKVCIKAVDCLYYAFRHSLASVYDRLLLQALRIVYIAARVLRLVCVLLSILLYHNRAMFLVFVFALRVLYNILLAPVLRSLFARNILEVAMA